MKNRGSAIFLFHKLERKGASRTFSFAQASSHIKAYTYSMVLSRSGTRTPKKKEDALENMKKNYVTHSNSSYAILIWTGLSTGTPSTCKYIKVVPRIQDLAQMRLMEDGASVYQQFCPCTLTWSNTGISWIPRSAPECTFYSKGS